MGFSGYTNALKEIIIRTLETLVNTGLQGFLFTQFQVFGVCSVKICSISSAVFFLELSKTAVYLIDSGVYGSEEQIAEYMKTIGRDTFKTLQTIRDLDGICNYYPAWDHTYSVSDIDEKINDAEHIICTLDKQVQTILEIDKATDITIITNLICERQKMPYLKENPLFRKTILAHCLNHGDF